MKREALSAVVLALLAVVALGVAAATLDTAVTVDGGGFGAGGGADGLGPTEDTTEAGPSETAGGRPVLSVPPVCYEFLRDPPALILFAVGLLIVGTLAYHDSGSPFAGAVIAGTVGFPVAVVGYLLSVCRPPDATFEAALGVAGDGERFLPVGGGGGTGLGGGSGTVSTPELLFVAVVVIALLVSTLLLVTSVGDDEEDGTAGGDEPDDPDTADPDLAEVARTAGEAADRIESATADNEVYDAWRRMTTVLDVERPASSTPAEFAAAAVEAGVDEEPVDQLTDVFERVRYGGADPTDDRERLAVEALRRIEAEHGGGR